MKRFSQLTQTATEADLVAGNFLAIDVPGVGGATKKVPGNCVAPKSVQFDIDLFVGNTMTNSSRTLVYGNVKLLKNKKYIIRAKATGTLAQNTYVLLSQSESGTDVFTRKIDEGWDGSERAYEFTPSATYELLFIRTFSGDNSGDVDITVSVESGLYEDVKTIGSVDAKATSNIDGSKTFSKALSSYTTIYGNISLQKNYEYTIEVTPSANITSNVNLLFSTSSLGPEVRTIVISGPFSEKKVVKYTPADNYDGLFLRTWSSFKDSSVSLEIVIKSPLCVLSENTKIETDALDVDVNGNVDEKTLCDLTKPSVNNAAIEFGYYDFVAGNTYKINLSAENSISSTLLYFYINDGDNWVTRRRLDSDGSWDGGLVSYEFTTETSFNGRVFIWCSTTTTGIHITCEIVNQTGLVNGLKSDVAKKAELLILTTSERRNAVASAGALCFDTDAKQLCEYDGSEWIANRKPMDIVNPLLDEVADPDILEKDGWFYIVHSLETNVSDIGAVGLLRTKDWNVFERIDPAFTDGPTTESYWAPDINFIAGKFVVYTSANRPRRLIAYTADHIDGPWKYEGVLVGTGGQIPVPKTTTPIDPEFAYDRATGKQYLFFGSYISSDPPNGKQYAVELTENGLECASGATAQEVANVAGEGATIVYHDGYYYLIVSVGMWGGSSYHCVYGRSTSLLGPYLNKSGQSMLDGYSETLWGTNKNTYIKGRGHGGTIFSDKNGRWYMPVHAWKANESQAAGDLRQLCLFEVKFDANGWLVVDDSTEYHQFISPNI